MLHDCPQFLRDDLSYVRERGRADCTLGYNFEVNKNVFSFVEWAVSVLRAWYGWVGGSALAGLIGLGHSMGWWTPTRRAYLWLVAVGFVFSMFESWRKEKTAREEANQKLGAAEKRIDDGRPRINVEVHMPDDWSVPEGSCGPFWIKNYGGRPARMIKFDPIPAKSLNLSLELQEIPLLSLSERPPVAWNFGSYVDAGVNRLRYFFKDNPSGRGTLTYPIRITFLDVDGAQLEEHLMLECQMPEMKLRIYPKGTEVMSGR